MHPATRWPKGPFPEKYRFDAVAARLDGAWSLGPTSALVAALGGPGGWVDEAYDDPYVRVFGRAAATSADDGAWLRDARSLAVDSGCHVFVWSPPDRGGRGDGRMADTDAPMRLGVVASADPIDAIVACGVAGPAQGVGLTTVVRFVATLRSFATLDVDTIGEDRLGMTLAPRSVTAPSRIAERALQVCPGLVRSVGRAEDLEARMAQTGRLDLDWSS